MNGKIVNLRTARKRKAREEKAKTGDANAARFGIPKAQRETDARARNKAARDLDAHRRERDD